MIVEIVEIEDIEDIDSTFHMDFSMLVTKVVARLPRHWGSPITL